jgi:alpha-galactosidase
MVQTSVLPLLAAVTTLLSGHAQASKQYDTLHPRFDKSRGTPEVIIPGASSYNGLNLVPQMGWNNWNAFQCEVNETLLLDTARKMVSLGLRDAGYNYIVLDDCWSIGRNSSGYLVENRE